MLCAIVGVGCATFQVCYESLWLSIVETQMQAHTCQYCRSICVKLPNSCERQDDWIYEWPISQSVEEARLAATDGCGLFKPLSTTPDLRRTYGCESA